jgi:hypothetical protein
VNAPLLTIPLDAEHDVVVARQRARQLARHLGFETQDQARIATAVSEIARNVIEYAGRGALEFVLEGRTPPQILAMHFTDEGPGIADLDASSPAVTSLRRGWAWASSGRGGSWTSSRSTPVPAGERSSTCASSCPAASPPGRVRRRASVDVLAPREPPEPDGRGPAPEPRAASPRSASCGAARRSWSASTASWRRPTAGVVALYAELDEKAEHLRRADQMKTRFLSNMSHEFRTPLNSILAISRLLADRADGS